MQLTNAKLYKCSSQVQNCTNTAHKCINVAKLYKCSSQVQNCTNAAHKCKIVQMQLTSANCTNAANKCTIVQMQLTSAQLYNISSQVHNCKRVECTVMGTMHIEHCNVNIAVSICKTKIY